MGSYLNPGSERFRTSLRSQIYVDKSLLIAEINKLVRTEQNMSASAVRVGSANPWRQICCLLITVQERIRLPCLTD